MIKTVIFDLDDTLLWDKKSVKEAFVATCQYAKKTYNEIDIGELEQAVREEARKLYASYETYPFTKLIGINPFEGLWGDFTDKINIGFRKMKEIVPAYRKDAWTNGLKKIGINDEKLGQELAELFPANRRKLPFVYDDTFAVLDELKKNYQLILLTNGSPTLQNEKLDMTPELVPYFDYIIISGSFGKGKPDPKIFEHCLYLADVTKDKAIMVGDNLNTDILGSNRIGMKNVWINRENLAKNPDIPATFEISSLSELPAIVRSL